MKPTAQSKLDDFDAQLQSIFAFEDWLLEFESNAYPADWIVGRVNVWPLLKVVFSAYITEHKLPHRVRRIKRIMRDYSFMLPGALVDRMENRRDTSGASMEGMRLADTLLIAPRQRFIGPHDNILMPLYDHLSSRFEDIQQSVLPVCLSDKSSGSALTSRFFGEVACCMTSATRPAVEDEDDLKNILALSSMREWLKQVAGKLSIRPDSARHLATRQIIRCLSATSQMETLLDATKASEVYFDSFGYAGTFALVAAAKAKGVTSIEIQHGLYRPIEASHDTSRAPNFMLVPSKRMTFSEDISPTQHPVPMLNRSLKLYQTHDIYRSTFTHPTNTACEGGTIVRPTKILVTQQAFDDLSWLYEFAKQSKDDVQWWIRLCSDLSIAAKAEALLSDAPNVIITDQSVRFAGDFFQYVDGHVTLFSATALEALSEKLPTFSLLPSAQRFPDFEVASNSGTKPSLDFGTLSSLTDWAASLPKR